MPHSLRPLLALVHLFLAASALLAVMVVIETPVLGVETRFETELLLLAVGGGALTSLLLRGWIDTLLDVLRPLRLIDTATAVYVAMCGLFVFGLLVHEGRADTVLARRHFHYLAAMLLVAEPIVLLLAGTPRGLGLALVNGLLLVVIAAVADDYNSPVCLGYAVLAAQALVARHHLRELSLLPQVAKVPLGPVLRHLSWTTVVLLGLAAITQAALPRTPFRLTFEMPTERRSIELYEVILRLLLLLGLVVLAGQLISRLIRRLRASPRRSPPRLEVEAMWVPPEPPRPLTRRFGLRMLLDPRSRLIDEFTWLVGRLASRGLPRPPAQTAHEYAVRLAEFRPAAKEAMDELVTLFARARYTDEPIGRAEVHTAHQLARRVAEAAADPR